MDTMDTTTPDELISITRTEESGLVVPDEPMAGILIGSVIGLFLWGGIILLLSPFFKYWVVLFAMHP